MKEILHGLQQHGLSKLASYFEHPVSDASLLRSLQQRATAFELNGHAVPCSIVPELTYDMGSRRLNSQLFISVIDTKKTERLMDVISRKLSYEPTSQNTGAALVVERTFSHRLSKRLAKPAWRYEEALIVIQLGEGGLVSQHVLTSSTMKSILVSSSSQRKKSYDIDKFNAMIPHASELIRGLNDRAIAWNGKQWGLVEVVPEGSLVVGDRAIGTGKFGRFHPEDLGQALHLGMAERHSEYDDGASGLMIPTPGQEPDRPRFRDWLMTAGEPVVYQTAEGGSSGGGGVGGRSTETGLTYTGSGACAAQYSSRDACYACCDTQGSQVLAAGLAITTAVTAAGIAATAPSVIGAVIAGIALAVIGVTGSLVVAWTAADACKSACTNTLQPVEAYAT